MLLHALHALWDAESVVPVREKLINDFIASTISTVNIRIVLCSRTLHRLVFSASSHKSSKQLERWDINSHSLGEK